MTAPIRIAILANGRQARAEMRGVAASGLSMGNSLKKARNLVAGVFAVSAIKSAGAAWLKVGGDYQTSLNKIQALTGASNTALNRAAKQLEANSGAYAKMGQTTGDAAAGVVELTKAGMSLSDSLKAVRATMTLAKAGELEVGDASTLVANTLNTFHLRAKRAGDIANYLANAANISSADVSDLAESFKYVSPLAAKAGVPLAQVNAVLAELSNSGIKSSQAGTSFRTFLLNLQAPTPAASKALRKLNVEIYDAQGNMRPLPNLINQLNDGLGTLSQAQQNAALKDIFGKIGITGAQVILKNGTEGLATYTKGVERAGAATKLANSASRGLKGTLDTMKASAISTAQELYRKYSPALNSRLQDLGKWVGENKGEFIDAGKAARDLLLPPLKLLFDLAKTGAKVLGAIPGPVKSIGVQAGIAALVLSRFTGAVTKTTARLAQWRAEMTYSVTRTQRLAAAARSAAGIGGLLLLSNALSKTEDKARGLNTALGKTAGGALVGFSVGGPVGAAVGTVAGLGASFHDLRLSIARSLGVADQFTDKTAAAAKAANRLQVAIQRTKNSIDGLAGTLTASGLVTGSTRLSAIADLSTQIPDLGKGVAALGVPMRTIGKAAVGNKQALDQMFDTLRNKADAGGYVWINGVRYQIHTLEDAFDHAATSVKAAQKQVREGATVTQHLSKALKGLPANTRTKIEATGVVPTLRGVAKVARQYHLTPKRIKTIMEALHIKGTVADVKRVQSTLDDTSKHSRKANDALRGVGKAKPNLNPFNQFFNRGMSKARRDATKGAQDANEALRKGTSKARPQLDPFLAALSGNISTARSKASRGGNQVGASLSSGVAGGIAVHAADAASALLVDNALAAARRAADSHSPSRKMQKLGHDLGDGLLVGMRDRQKAVDDAARRLTETAITGSTKGLRGGGAVEVFRAGGHVSRVQVGDLHVTGTLQSDLGPVKIEGIARTVAQQEIEADRHFQRVRAGG